MPTTRSACWTKELAGACRIADSLLEGRGALCLSRDPDREPAVILRREVLCSGTPRALCPSRGGVEGQKSGYAEDAGTPRAECNETFLAVVRSDPMVEGRDYHAPGLLPVPLFNIHAETHLLKPHEIAKRDPACPRRFVKLLRKPYPAMGAGIAVAPCHYGELSQEVSATRGPSKLDADLGVVTGGRSGLQASGGKEFTKDFLSAAFVTRC